MITAEERAHMFKEELKEFLKKWETELEIEHDYWTDEPTMKVYLQGKFDSDNECLAEFTEVNLGRYVYPD